MDILHLSLFTEMRSQLKVMFIVLVFCCFETISGRKPAQAVDSVGWQSIFEWATPLGQAHRYLELLDPYISSSSSEIPETGVIQKVVDLVYTCTQHVPSMSPRMSHVVHQLQQLVPPVMEI